MGLFGKSFEEEVEAAIVTLRSTYPAVHGLTAQVNGKTVTLKGEAASMEVKTALMQEFNALVKTDNTFNTITLTRPPGAVRLPGPPSMPEAAPLPTSASPGEHAIHVVVSGDTLGALAKKYYGKASLYVKIFEANKDILKNPDVIKIGQKLRIPK